jgi:membrane protease YdiL (CAAX protease family)
MTDLDLNPEPTAAVEMHVPPRIPHIGHAILFLLFALGTIFASQLAVVGIAHLLPSLHALSMGQIIHIPRLTVISSFVAYPLVLGISIIVFPAIWHRSFASGISWNLNAAIRNVRWLIPAGVGIAILSAVSEAFQTIPKSLPVDKFFQSRLDLWLVSILGTLLAPAFEEICFRGFLLPAVAIAYEWSATPSTPEGRILWHSTNDVSSAALVIGAVVSSAGFVLMHGPQLHYTIGPLSILFCVSLALSAIRIRLRSVAASTLVHASYNGFLFAMTFISTRGYTHLDKLGR